MNKGSQKGITLIALIITIIVILILVAVSVRTISKSGLFDHAKDATRQWADRQEEEANINIDSYVDEYTTDYGKYYDDPNVKPTNPNYFTWAIDDEEAKTVILTGIKDEYAVKGYYSKNNRYYNIAIQDGSTKITDVIIPGKVEIDGKKYTVIGIEKVALGREFYETGDSDSEFTSIILPKTIEYIGDAAFGQCTNLRSIKIPNSVIFIGEDTFYGCYNLVNIEIPASVTTMGHRAFDTWSNAIINCQAEEKPIGWDDYWCYSNAQVNWGVEM